MHRFFCFLLFLCLTAGHAQAKRLALIIGNDSYFNLPKEYQLEKARNDAHATAKTFEKLGFDISLGLDLKRLEINSQLSTLVSKIESDDEVVFFFAGHGVQIEGQNYLLPSDIPSIGVADKVLLKTESIRVDSITDMFKRAGARLSILVLDACRTNPYKDSRKRAIGGTRGLATMTPPEGTLVLFSAGADQAALDRLNEHDRNPNSIFTRHFLPLVSQKGLELNRLSRKLRASVRKLAKSVGHKQIPAVYNEVNGDVYLAGQKVAISAKLEQKKGDDLLWEQIAKSNKASDFKFFLQTHPDSRYSSLAKYKLHQLKGQQLTLLSPPVKTTRQFNIPNADKLKKKAWIGVQINNNTTLRLNDQAPHGIYISSVNKQSPAEKSGLKQGDIITKINNTPVNRISIFVEKILEHGIGNEIKLTVHRDGSDRLLTLKTASRYESFHILHLSQENGSTRNHLDLARAYRWEPAIDDNMTHALKWYEKAAKTGDETAMFELAGLYLYGTEIKKDMLKSVEFFQKAAIKNHVASMHALGNAYRYGWGTDKDYAKTIDWYLKAISAGSANAMYDLGYMMQHSEGVKKDVQSAIGHYQNAAAKNHQAAMIALGNVYKNGKDVSKDIPLALSWYRKAADLGNITAYKTLAGMFKEGEGVTRDFHQAIKWYEKAADKNDTTAMYAIGGIYRREEFSGKDPDLMLTWYRKAAEAGHKSAHWEMGHAYEHGQGVKKDKKIAHEWYEKGAAKGEEYCMYQLGENYDSGTVVIRNHVSAADWIMKSLAVKNGAGNFYFAKHWKELSSETRRLLQTRLKEKGFYTGKIDGDFGPDSMNAVRAYAESGKKQ